MSARDEILNHPGLLATADAEIATLLDAYRVEVAAETRRQDAEYLLAVSREHASRQIYRQAIRDCAHLLQTRAEGVTS